MSMEPHGDLRRNQVAQVKRRSLVLAPLAIGCIALGAGSSRASTPPLLPAPVSLADELAAALQARRPLVVMASLVGCPFCKIVRESHLVPLRRDDALPVVQLDVRNAQAVRNFDGSAATHDLILRAWNVTVTPTVLFFGRDGREIAERLVGASIPDFYGAYLEERLRTARRTLG